MIPPSLTVIGGSSTIALSINSFMSCNSSKLLYKSFNIIDEHFSKLFFTSGNFANEFSRVTISLALAFPYDILLDKRSMSYTFFRFSSISPLNIMSSFNSFTAFNLLFISTVSTRGSFNHLLSNLPPIDVDVLSNTQSRVPFFDLSLIFSVISRFLLAFISNDIYFDILYNVILLMLSNAVICVCSIY